MNDVPIARLLSAATRMIIDDMHRDLAELGHPGLRPAYGYALNAVGASGATTAALAAELGMTKQGAAKLVASLVELGYLRRGPHTEDARATLLTLTPRGRDLLERAAEVQERLEGEWERVVGKRAMASLRSALEGAIVARHPEGRPGLRPIW